MLKGQKVQLRPVRGSDLKYFLEWYNDPEVTQYLGIYLPMTEIAEGKFIESLGSDTTSVMFVIEAIDGGAAKPIGSTDLTQINPKDHNATFGIAIGDKSYWSQGYGTEVAELIVRYGFEQLNLHRINSFAFAFNERSVWMHKKIGFKVEGSQRHRIYKNGNYQNDVVFGLLRNEWQELNGNK